MTDATQPHDSESGTNAEPGHAAAVDHDDHDDHAHGAEALGPIDTWSWGAGALGLVVAAIMVLCFALATSDIPAG